MPVDLSVFDKVKTFDDYNQLEQEFQLKKQLAAAQIQTAQAAILKAQEMDAGKLGEQAFMKAAQGLPLSPQENAALRLLDAKQQNVVFNPATGAREEKPSLLDRAGLGGAATASPVVAPPPMASPRQPAQQPPMSNEQAAQVVDLFEGNGQPINDAPKPAPIQNTSDTAMQAELNANRGNPKLQQSIREKYTGSKTPDKLFSMENTLRDEFNTNTKSFRTVQDAYSKIGKTSDTGPGDMSMLYQYVKLLDPDSVVRESEFASAAASGSYGDRIAGAVKSIMSGGRLDASLRQQFMEEADNVYTGQLEGYNRAKDTYKGLAERNTLNVQNVITDYAQAEPPATRAAKKSPPKMGEVRKGTDGDYLFNGGNPGDPKSWRKVK